MRPREKMVHICIAGVQVPVSAKPYMHLPWMNSGIRKITSIKINMTA